MKTRDTFPILNRPDFSPTISPDGRVHEKSTLYCVPRAAPRPNLGKSALSDAGLKADDEEPITLMAEPSDAEGAAVQLMDVVARRVLREKEYSETSDSATYIVIVGGGVK